jgi:3' terminal RNA ribose 2'-O-methyltransferase Hen1
MLLTITCRGENATDIGYVLRKRPGRLLRFDRNKNTIGVLMYWPRVEDDLCQFAMQLDIDPLDMSPRRPGAIAASNLFDYVNDRPYATSRLMGSAIAWFLREALYDRPLPEGAPDDVRERVFDLEARIFAFEERGLAKDAFEALGYETDVTPHVLDDEHPSWGLSPYADVRVRKNETVTELLQHLHVMLSALPKPSKNESATKEVAERLLRVSGTWLADHPMRNKLVWRYLSYDRALASDVMDKLACTTSEDTASDGATSDDATDAEPKAKHVPLHTQVLDTVSAIIRESGCTSVLDAGCGDGKLVRLLLGIEQVERIGAADVSATSLRRLQSKLTERRRTAMPDNLDVFQASVTMSDDRLRGYDAICAIEVVEHIDPRRIRDLERVVFEESGASLIVVTTPNREYNRVYGIPSDLLRHPDHRFEWTRDEFARWVTHVCETYGYTSDMRGVGEVDEAAGQPTLVATFRKERP